MIRYKSPKQQEEEQVRISTIECIWGSACGSIENETRFFEAGGMTIFSIKRSKTHLIGIFLLLNLLETGSHLVQKHSLGCLLDFLENARAVFHFLEWRSTKNPNNGVANLLIQLWISEEIALGGTKMLHRQRHSAHIPQRVVKQGPSGSIVTGSNPLLGSNQVLVSLSQLFL